MTIIAFWCGSCNLIIAFWCDLSVSIIAFWCANNNVISEILIIMKRKIYDRLLKWKNESKGETALLIDGARRVGKSYIAKEFAEKEYRSQLEATSSLL